MCRQWNHRRRSSTDYQLRRYEGARAPWVPESWDDTEKRGGLVLVVPEFITTSQRPAGRERTGRSLDFRGEDDVRGPFPLGHPVLALPFVLFFIEFGPRSGGVNSMRVSERLLLSCPLSRMVTGGTAVEPATEANEGVSADKGTNTYPNDGRRWDYGLVA